MSAIHLLIVQMIALFITMLLLKPSLLKRWRLILLSSLMNGAVTALLLALWHLVEHIIKPSWFT